MSSLPEGWSYGPWHDGPDPLQAPADLRDALDEIGRYVVSSLKPGAYTVTTSYAGSAFVPASQIVAVTDKAVATADLALDPGRSVTFSVADVVFPGANGSVGAELRNADGRVVKVFRATRPHSPAASSPSPGCR